MKHRRWRNRREAGAEAMSALHVISLGAGVQSTTLALMATAGEIGPMPAAAIFADTGDESDAVYRHLEWLRSGVLAFPVRVVSEGVLSADLLAGEDAARVPCHVGAGGLAFRQCTRNYKIRPIRRSARALMEELGVKVAPGAVVQWVGISTDEALRQKPSGVEYVRNRFPLLEKRMTRADCLRWLAARGFATPPKSSCVFCPYKSAAQWRDLRDNDPTGWAKAVAFDAALRTPTNVARFRGELFVHSSRRPLAVAPLGEPPRQVDLFTNECEGMCGV